MTAPNLLKANNTEQVYSQLVDALVDDLTKAKAMLVEAQKLVQACMSYVEAMDPAAANLLRSTTPDYDAVLIDSAIRAIVSTKS